MVNANTLAGKHRMMPIVVPVSYYSRQARDQYSSAVSVASAEWRPTSNETRVLADVGVDVESRVWHLWTQQLQSVRPKVGDYLTESDGTVWRVVGPVTCELGGARWGMTTVKGVPAAA
jgi:hypothetical protein